MLDRGAAIHHHGYARIPRSHRGRFVDNAELHPDRLYALSNRVVHDRPDILRAAENVDKVDRVGDGDQVGISALAEDLGNRRVDRDDPVALALKVARNTMAWP